MRRARLARVRSASLDGHLTRVRHVNSTLGIQRQRRQSFALEAISPEHLESVTMPVFQVADEGWTIPSMA
jgi:tRNA U34 2-thiouridine synthase MnmA/TrmU